MKRENAESPKISPAGPESAEIYDFLYVDRARVSALYAQLFPQGTLTSVKTTALQSFSDDSNIGSDIKIIKAETSPRSLAQRESSACLMPRGRFRWKFWIA